MANSSAVFRELRAVFDGVDGQGLLQVYVLIEAHGDSPLGVQGWHHKAFGENESLHGVLEKWKSGDEDPILWPLGAPK